MSNDRSRSILCSRPVPVERRAQARDMVGNAVGRHPQRVAYGDEQTSAGERQPFPIPRGQTRRGPSLDVQRKNGHAAARGDVEHPFAQLSARAGRAIRQNAGREALGQGAHDGIGRRTAVVPRRTEVKTRYAGVEEMNVAVMGCVVNGPGESKHSNIGISLPGTFEEPKAPVYVDGRLMLTLKGDHIVAEFIKILDDYVDSHYAAKPQLAISS